MQELFFRGTPQLETERLVLRKITPDDADDIFEYASDDEVAKYVTWDTHKSVDDTRNFINFILGRYERDEAGEWGIALKENGKLIGTIGFTAYSVKSRRAEIGYVLSRKYWGQGIMTEAVNLVLKFAFEDMGLNRIESLHVLDNEKSGKVMQKAGMSFEGIIRERIYFKNKFWDAKQYAILRSDWLKQQNHNDNPSEGAGIGIMKQFPILEFDPAREAVIEPGKVIKPIDIPERCVICFFKEVIDGVAERNKLQVITELKSECGVVPVYKMETDRGSIAVFNPFVGAPNAAGMLEEVIARGCNKFIACGGAGVLNKDIAVGHLIIPTSAVRDEGTSYHYLPPSREVGANAHAVRTIQNVLEKHGVKYLTGKTWTTDALFRETREKVALRKSEGCVTVEMECAAFLAVSKFRNVIFGQILYGGDDVSGIEWDVRGGTSRKSIRERVFDLAVECCLEL